jgi:hypothetical protein
MMSKKQIFQALSSILLGKGFKFSGGTWVRDSGNLKEVIGSQFSSKTGSVTFNVGIADRDVWKIYWDEHIPEFVDDAKCIAKRRIGEILPSGTDRWWKIDEFNEASASEVVDAALHFFEKLSSRENLLAHLKSRKFLVIAEKPYIPIILHLLGQSESALSLLKELETGSGDAWDLKIKRIFEVVSSGNQHIQINTDY